MCGVDVTSMEVSRAAQKLDEELEKWRNRPLGEIPFLQVDARYEDVRMNGSVVSVSTLVVVGINKGRQTKSAGSQHINK